MTNQEFTKALIRTRIVLVREIDEVSGCGKNPVKQLLLIRDDKAIADFTEQFHDEQFHDRTILI